MARALVLSLLATLLMGVTLPARADSPAVAGVLGSSQAGTVDLDRAVMLNAVLGSIAGTPLSLSTVEWGRLASGEIEAADLVAALVDQGDEPGGDATLAASVPIPLVLSAAAATASGEGADELAAALGVLAGELGGHTARASLSELLGSSADDLDVLRVNVLDLVTGLLQASQATTDPLHEVSVAGSSLGLAAAINSVKVTARTTGVTQYTVGSDGAAYSSAGLRVRLRLDLVDLSPTTSALTSALSPLGDVTSRMDITDAELYVDVAPGAGTIDAVDAVGEAVTLQATPGTSDVYLGSIPEALFFDTSRAVQASDLSAVAIGTLAIRVTVPILGTVLTDVAAPVAAKATALGSAPDPARLVVAAPFPAVGRSGTSSAELLSLHGTLVSTTQVSLNGSLGPLLNPLVNGTILPAIKPAVTTSIDPVLATALTSVAGPAVAANGIAVDTATATVAGMRSPVVVTVDQPSISGDAVVDGTLTAVPGTVSPSDAVVSYEWRRGTEVVGTDPTYTPTAADVGSTITLVQTATVAEVDPVSATSDPVGPVVEAVFSAAPTAGIDGVAQVGEELTAVVGDSSPVADSYTYEWLVGGEVVAGAEEASFTPGPSAAGESVEARVTAVRDGYVSLPATSDPVGPVAAAVFGTAPTVSVEGVAQVGQQLTAVVTDSVPSADSYTYEWLVGGDVVDGADEDTFVPGAGALGRTVRARVTAIRAGYADAPVMSDPTTAVVAAPVPATPPTARIAGRAQVGQELTAVVVDSVPSALSYSYQWCADGTPIPGATGSAFAVAPAQIGEQISVVVTATLVGSGVVFVQSAPTAPVLPGVFGAPPMASFTGVLKVGEELAAVVGPTKPVADSHTYQWRADGTPIPGATGSTLILAADQVGQRISVAATAVRAGYVDATGVSPESAPVAPVEAPSLSLSSSARTVRLGGSATLTWAAENADSLVASGAWSGARSVDGGSVLVTPKKVGSPTYVLTATNVGGTTTAQVTLPVKLPATTFRVNAPDRAQVGDWIRVRVRDAAARESIAITLGKALLRTVVASASGTATVRVHVTAALGTGHKVLRATGDSRDRRGGHRIRVVPR